MTTTDAQLPEVAAIKIPTCRELAKVLLKFGNQPLISGRSDYAITGFYVSPDGFIRTAAIKFSPDKVSNGMEVQK